MARTETVLSVRLAHDPADASLNSALVWFEDDATSCHARAYAIKVGHIAATLHFGSDAVPQRTKLAMNDPEVQQLLMSLMQHVETSGAELRERHHAELAAASSALAAANAGKDAAVSAKDAEIRHLRDQVNAANASVAEVTKLRNEIAQLKSTNHVKGATGEAFVEALLRENFKKDTVERTARVGKSLDIQLRDASSLLAFEVKNKGTISAQDVASFQRDAAAVFAATPDAVAAMFLSLGTSNIPHKGSCFLDVVQGRPVLYAGFGSQHDAAPLIPRLVQLLRQVGVGTARMTNHGRVNALTSALAKVRDEVATMVRAHSEARRCAAQTVVSIDAIQLAGVQKLLRDLLEDDPRPLAPETLKSKVRRFLSNVVPSWEPGVKTLKFEELFQQCIEQGIQCSTSHFDGVVSALPGVTKFWNEQKSKQYAIDRDVLVAHLDAAGV